MNTTATFFFSVANLSRSAVTTLFPHKDNKGQIKKDVGECGMKRKRICEAVHDLQHDTVRNLYVFELVCSRTWLEAKKNNNRGP